MNKDIESLLNVAKYLKLSNSIKGQEESITYILCHKLFFDGEEFKRPKDPADKKVRKIIRKEENNRRFISLLDSLDLASKEIQALTYRDQQIKAFPTALVEWEETEFDGKYAHLSYGNKYSAEGFSAAECTLLTVLYTAFVLIEYNK